MQTRAVVVSVNRSSGGVPKTAVFEGFIGENGLDGDRQRFSYHGGRDRAVVLFSLDAIHALQREGHPIGVGSTGENITISGLDWSSVLPRTRLQLGGAEVQITTFAAPCETIAGSFLNRNFARISQSLHPGWSRVCARVLSAGLVRPGDTIALLS